MFDLAYAMAPPPEGADPAGGGGGILTMLPPMIMMFVIFYFLLIRPQQKKQREHDKLLEQLKEGDNIVTHGGIHGTVRKVKDDIVTLEVAPNVKIKINRSSIGTLRVEGAAREDAGRENKS